MNSNVMFHNYYLSLQSAGPGDGVGILYFSSPFKPKRFCSTFSQHQARASKSEPYNQPQIRLKMDQQVQTFPLESQIQKEEPQENIIDGPSTSYFEEEGGEENKDEILGLEMDSPDGNIMPIRRRNQMMKRSTMIAKQVISIQSAATLGFVSQLWVDPASWTVLIVEVRPNLLSGEIERLFLEDVAKVGDVLLIEDESMMENDFKLLGLETLVGYTVVTPGRRIIGKVRGYTFDINSGAIESLELDSFGISVIPSSLVSTYRLFVEDVVGVSTDTVMVHEAAASRIQRLTKGFWGGSTAPSRKKNMGGDKYRYSKGDDDEPEECYSEDDDNSDLPDHDYIRQRRKKFVGREKNSPNCSFSTNASCHSAPDSDSIPSTSIEDCYEFLYLVASAQEDGVRVLYDSEGIQFLASQMPTLPSDGSNVVINCAMELVQLMITKLPAEEIYIKHPSELVMFVVEATRRFGLLHTDVKFKALRLLSVILSSLYSAPVRSALWSVEEDSAELPDVITSDPIPANRCIQLVFETSRVEIAVLNVLAYLRNEASKTTTALSSSSLIETMAVKCRNLSIMFSLVEAVIELVSKFEGEDHEEDSHFPDAAILSDSILMKIMSGLNETVSVVLEYLQDAKEHGQNKGDDLFASVRVIGRYLAETPDICREKVVELLKFYAFRSRGSEVRPFYYSTCFLLPMLCQMTLRADGCELFVTSGALEAVIDYLVSFILPSGNRGEDESAMFMTCRAVLNFLLNRVHLRSALVYASVFKLLGALPRWSGHRTQTTRVSS
ncbi:OLC1v1035286C1 [Oldenlandia corymbosa var. corymbosa]|uniref:OLC1v1035286C1 n=1 Tax=Oldenlandia corymbosa var. corymbosa TaxID=529605 RepID=A0AAV1CVX4_OLDCO|nr:OLC1v1035286C1 [Oldenlandia corymbosa var. corymbosa]